MVLTSKDGEAKGCGGCHVPFLNGAVSGSL